MRLTALLPSLFTLGALSSPIVIANPGEIIPHTSGIIPSTATWYCTYSYEIMFEDYVLEGHKWAVTEKELRELIPGTVTSWEFQALDQAGPRVGFKAKWALPIGQHGKVEKKLNAFIRDDEDFKCHHVDHGPLR